MAEEHVFALSIEASGEVTRARATEPEPSEDENDEELTDG